MKKVIIIGAGVSGLTTGIYLKANGYDVEIIEKNATLGGACIGWKRKGCYIDGCIHWLIGVNPNSQLNKLWKDTGAIDKDTKIFYQDDLVTYKLKNGKELTFWADTKKLEKSLTEFAPEDKKQIKKFVNLIRKFQKVDPPSNKPVELMNLFDLLKVAFTLGGKYPSVLRTSTISCEDFAKRFKNPELKEIMSIFMVDQYNLMSMLYMLGHISAKDGGIPIGGSVAMVKRMEKKFLSLGGNILKNTSISKIVVEKNVAKGVILGDNQFHPADWVVSTVPIEHCFVDLLDGKFSDKKFEMRLNNQEDYPIYTYTFIAIKCPVSVKDKSLAITVPLTTPIVMDKEYTFVTFRNYSYDQTLNSKDGYCVIQATVHSNDNMYFWWKNVKDNGNYTKEKKRVAEQLLSVAKTVYPDVADQLEVIDTITPCTYERYLNSRHGSFQGFIHTSRGKALMQNGKVKGLKNFLLSGQWTIRSGGLPPAVMSGRFSAQRICKADKKKFKNPQ